jgi:hypothetical protein
MVLDGMQLIGAKQNRARAVEAAHLSAFPAQVIAPGRLKPLSFFRLLCRHAVPPTAQAPCTRSGSSRWCWSPHGARRQGVDGRRPEGSARRVRGAGAW